MLKKSLLAAFLLGALVIPSKSAFSHERDDDGDGEHGGIAGVWICNGQRVDAGVTINFPIQFVFHADGIFQYSSGSKLHHRGYRDRGRADGRYHALGKDRYAWKSVELLYNYPSEPTSTLDDWTGTLYVDATVKYDPATDTLCSGRPECPGDLTKVLFCPAGYKSTAECAKALANSMCARFDAGFPAYPPF